MLEQLVDKLARIGREQAPSIVKCDQLPAGSFYVRDNAGNLVLTKAEDLYTPSAESVMDFMNVLAQYREVIKATAKPCTVFIEDTRVVGLFDLGGDRRQRVLWELAQTSAFSKAAELEDNNRKHTHQEFLRLMRLHFIDYLPLGLYDQLRQVRFTRKDDAESGKSQGKVSIGKALQAEMMGADKIPEIVTLELKVFERADFTGNNQPVRFDLDIDPGDGSFTFRPLADELIEAKFRSQRKLQQNIVQRFQDFKITGECVVGAP